MVCGKARAMASCSSEMSPVFFAPFGLSLLAVNVLCTRQSEISHCHPETSELAELFASALISPPGATQSPGSEFSIFPGCSPAAGQGVGEPHGPLVCRLVPSCPVCEAWQLPGEKRLHQHSAERQGHTCASPAQPRALPSPAARGEPWQKPGALALLRHASAAVRSFSCAWFALGRKKRRVAVSHISILLL